MADFNNSLSLLESWELYCSDPGQFDSSQQLLADAAGLQKYSVVVPSTVAMAVNGTALNCWQPNIDYTDYDWWYRCQFTADAPSIIRKFLNFQGLATLCSVWLNGELLLESNNMFRGYRVDVTDKLLTNNDLVLCFHSEVEALKLRKPRPRWKTKLVKNQQMRWLRTTVLGHVSEWTPPIKVVGPWRDVVLESVPAIDLSCLVITPKADQQHAQLLLQGTCNIVSPQAAVESLELTIADKTHPIRYRLEGDLLIIDDLLDLPELALWWPHTHNSPQLYDCQLSVQTSIGRTEKTFSPVGFKSVEFDYLNERANVVVNGESIFCRGACWSLSDYLSLSASEQVLREQLSLAKSVGINMLRVGGTMVYESDIFYTLCDELGILVWQDFMFASMDYPFEDQAFAQNAAEEAAYQLRRLSGHACIAVYCGNTDVEAQAAMVGVHRELWSNDFFSKELLALCQQLHSGIPYIPSSPTGGTLPFHLGAGVSHYWGVGAYMHQVDSHDIGRVKFSSEGMGLSHLPEDESITAWIDDARSFPNNSQWQSRVPRDLGAGWDFSDIRDFYLSSLFQVDAVALKRSDVDKYIALSRVVTGEVIANVYRRWRKAGSLCGGGLLWFFRDFWPCAGFGLIDSDNKPKPAYFILKRAWANQYAMIVDEGLDGAVVTVINEQSTVLEGTLELRIMKSNGVDVAAVTKEFSLAAHSKQSMSVDAELGCFLDTTYAYRFGAVQFEVVACRMRHSNGAMISEDVFSPLGVSHKAVQDVDICASVIELEDGVLELSVSSNRLLNFVSLTIRDYLAEDNYFHLVPGWEKVVKLRRVNTSAKAFRGYLSAINLNQSIKLKLGR